MNWFHNKPGDDRNVQKLLQLQKKKISVLAMHKSRGDESIPLSSGEVSRNRSEEVESIRVGGINSSSLDSRSIRGFQKGR